MLAFSSTCIFYHGKQQVTRLVVRNHAASPSPVQQFFTAPRDNTTHLCDLRQLHETTWFLKGRPHIYRLLTERRRPVAVRPTTGSRPPARSRCPDPRRAKAWTPAHIPMEPSPAQAGASDRDRSPPPPPPPPSQSSTAATISSPLAVVCSFWKGALLSLLDLLVELVE